MTLPLQAAAPLPNIKALPSAKIETHAANGSKFSAEVMREKAKEKAVEFETVFLSTMLDQMFEGISTEEPWGGGQAEETYRSFLNNEYASNIASNGGIGIADQIYTEILKMQEIDPS